MSEVIQYLSLHKEVEYLCDELMGSFDFEIKMMEDFLKRSGGITDDEAYAIMVSIAGCEESFIHQKIDIDKEIEFALKDQYYGVTYKDPTLTPSRIAIDEALGSLNCRGMVTIYVGHHELADNYICHRSGKLALAIYIKNLSTKEAPTEQ